MIQLVGFVSRLLRSLLKSGLSLQGSVLKLLTKSILVPLGLTAAASVTNAAFQKKIYVLGMTTVVANEELNDMQIVKSLEESGLLIKNKEANFLVC